MIRLMLVLLTFFPCGEDGFTYRDVKGKIMLYCLREMKCKKVL